jgi:plasmid stabilization system protein ParE
MVQVIWAGPAADDLQQIHDFIARDSARYARITIKKIERSAGLLAHFPLLGHVLPEFPLGPYRQTLSGAYRIIYRDDPENERVLIVAVIHAARNLPPIMKRRDPSI